MFKSIPNLFQHSSSIFDSSSLVNYLNLKLHLKKSPVQLKNLKNYQLVVPTKCKSKSFKSFSIEKIRIYEIAFFLMYN